MRPTYSSILSIQEKSPSSVRLGLCNPFRSSRGPTGVPYAKSHESLNRCDGENKDWAIGEPPHDSRLPQNMKAPLLRPPKDSTLHIEELMRMINACLHHCVLPIWLKVEIRRSLSKTELDLCTMDASELYPPVLDPRINQVIYYLLPPEEAQWQLQHVEESRVASLLISHTICLLIIYVAVTLRFVSRHIRGKGFHVDDWLMIAAAASLTNYFIVIIIGVARFGAGRHAILLQDPVSFKKVSHRSI